MDISQSFYEETEQEVRHDMQKILSRYLFVSHDGIIRGTETVVNELINLITLNDYEHK